MSWPGRQVGILRDDGSRSRPLVSVVVPVYKVERYIRECVESLVNQTLHDIEIIFVDDASPDASVAIIEESAAGDDRVIILRNSSNMGVGASRNRGLEAARADYVKVIDSDDYLSPTALEDLYRMADERQVDIVFHDAIYFGGQGESVHQDYFESAKPLSHMCGHAAWWYLFRRQLLLDHPELRFPEGPHPHEDTTFSFMLFTFCESSARLHAPCIYYRQHEQMVTKSVGCAGSGAYADSAVLCLGILCDFYASLPRHFKKKRYRAFLGLANYFASYCPKGEQPAMLRKMRRVDRFRRFIFTSKITKSNRHIIRVLGMPVWFCRRSQASCRIWR